MRKSKEIVNEICTITNKKVLKQLKINCLKSDIKHKPIIVKNKKAKRIVYMRTRYVHDCNMYIKEFAINNPLYHSVIFRLV